MLYPTLPAYAPQWAVIAAHRHRAGHRPAVRLPAGEARRGPRSRHGAGEAMILRDGVFLAMRAITAHRMRSGLTLLGIAVGIAAVILLTSIGEGVHRFVLAEFSQFGTNIIGVAPGRVKTGGAAPSGLPTAVRPLSFDDARALQRAAERHGHRTDRLRQRGDRRQRPHAPHDGLRRQRRRAAGLQHAGRRGPVPAAATNGKARAPSSCSAAR